MASKDDIAKVFLVDDHPIVRRGLTQVIDPTEDLTVCGEAENAASALRGIAQAGPDIVVVDLALESGDGLELIKSIRSQFGSLPILVLTMHDEPFYAERALKAGAQGFLTKQEASEEVVDAIYRILRGETYVSERVSPDLLKRLLTGADDEEDSFVARLSDRELQVFTLIGEGHSTQEIADELHLSVKTIETYRAHIKRKLELEDSRKLVQYAIRWVISHGKR